MTRKHLVTFAALAAAALLVPAGAMAAQTATATGTITAGSLTFDTTATPSFSAVLDGTNKTPTYQVPSTVTDATGSGNGWNITLTSTQFTTGGGSPKTLATNASTVTGLTSPCATGTCTNPTNSVSYPLGVPAGSTPPTAVKLVNAAASTGLGQFTVTPTVQVAVPSNTSAGTYSSTLTFAAVSGP